MRISVLAIALAAACKPSHVQTPHSDASADLEAKTVALVESKQGEARAYCSGVWVGADAVLTAAHCVSDFEPGQPVAFVMRPDLTAEKGERLEVLRFARLAARDADADLALLRVAGAPPHEYASPGDEPFVGQPVQTMGHPLGLWWSYSTGQVAAVRVDDMGHWVVQSTAPISPGNSGGGLFDTDGRLLGVCSYYYPRGENLNLYVHVQYVRDFLKAEL